MRANDDKLNLEQVSREFVHTHKKVGKIKIREVRASDDKINRVR